MRHWHQVSDLVGDLAIVSGDLLPVEVRSLGQGSGEVPTKSCGTSRWYSHHNKAAVLSAFRKGALQVSTNLLSLCIRVQEVILAQDIQVYHRKL